jgi:hypothetical protein
MDGEHVHCEREDNEAFALVRAGLRLVDGSIFWSGTHGENIIRKSVSREKHHYGCVVKSALDRQDDDDSLMRKSQDDGLNF